MANQNKIGDRKKAEKLNAIQSEVPNLESDTPNPEAEAAPLELQPSDDYVVNNVHMLFHMW